ncbi:lipopolysaccharide biosynthesis protein [Bacillus sp. Bva_UNVM-123]|uniref:lipopolysaccharide biosynthesis protein n=1 Tax=Bacillus sp. Bva_UNVM-123 TaxID=2829798 RepID=UPI00391F5AF1
MENELLKKKTASGLLWSFADIFASQGIQFIVLMVLARLLAPEYFGLIGMVAVFITIGNSIIDSGFTQALIREKNVSQQDYSTIFYFNLMMSILLYLLLYLTAPLISHFYGEKELIFIIRVLSIGLIINSFGIIQRVFLVKKINFKTQTKINLIAALLSSLVAILLAIQEFGVWSLVAQTLIMQFTRTILLWIINKWMPIYSFSIQSFKKYFGFSSKLLVSGLIDTLFNNVFSIIIGRLYPAAQLGYYTNATRLGDVITNSITGALQRVTYPVLSSIKDDETRLKNSFRKLIRTTTYLMFPIMIGLIAISDSLIPLIFGPNWFQSIIYFKLLCISGMLYPLHALNLNILQVKGRSDLFLKLEIIKKTLLSLLIVVSLYFSLGIIGLIGAAIISSYVSLFINAYYSAKEISYSITQQLKDLAPTFFIAIVMGCLVYIIGIILPENLFAKLFLQLISGALLYLLISWLFKIKEFAMILEMIFQFFTKLKQGKVRSRGA